MKLISILATISFLAIVPSGISLAQTTASWSTEDLREACKSISPGQTIDVPDGNYKDIHLRIESSGTKNKPIVIRAKNPGKVLITGDSKLEIFGDHVVLSGFFFKDGSRNPKQWGSHGAGLVTVYSSGLRITECAFHQFDTADGGWITVTPPPSGKVPKFVRIDHCSFTHKPTFDQVINLNNCDRKQWSKKYKKINGAPGAPAMFHRIDHCYFSNPKKTGNAGAGVRIGTWRNDIGSCLVDNNLFERQDSEAEIITSKSKGNLFFNNTFRNCQGTMNFRHGDQQALLNNWFLGTDQVEGYGGIFVWGSSHNIVGNFLDLSRTRKSRGNAGLYLNSGIHGSEHARADSSLIAKNMFVVREGSCIDLTALFKRRINWARQRKDEISEKDILPKDNQFTDNLFLQFDPKKNWANADDVKKSLDLQIWKSNRLFILSDQPSSLPSEPNSMEWKKINQKEANKVLARTRKDLTANKFTDTNLRPGDYPLNLSELVRGKVSPDEQASDMDIREVNEPKREKTFADVGPSWLKNNLSSYASKAKKEDRLQQMLMETHRRRKRRVPK